MEKASIFSAAGLPPPGLARPPAPACPHPATRAPRAPEGEACARLYPAPAALAGALVAVVCRDIRGLGLTDAQRLSHFCASPLLALSWFQDFEVGVVRERGGLPCWTPYGASVVLSGSQSHPFTSWAPSAGRGGMVCMTADAVRALFGLDPSTLQDRFVPAHGLLGRAWWPFLDALVAAPDDAATLAVLAQYLGPRWQAQAGQQGGMASLRRLGRHWVERLAFRPTNGASPTARAKWNAASRPTVAVPCANGRAWCAPKACSLPPATATPPASPSTGPTSPSNTAFLIKPT